MICKSADLLLNGTLREVICPSDVHSYRAVPKLHGDFIVLRAAICVGCGSESCLVVDVLRQWRREWVESTLACRDSSWGAGADLVGVFFADTDAVCMQMI